MMGAPLPRHRLALSPQDLAAITGGRWEPAPPPDNSLTEVHSRVPSRMAKGALYVAQPDSKDDAAALEAKLARAEKRGAGAFVVAEGVGLDRAVPRLVVGNPGRALLRISAVIRDAMPATRILITGTEGKTGCKDLLAHMAEGQRQVQSRLSSNNKDLPIAASLASLQPWHDWAILEVAAPSHAHALRRSALVRPDVCVITEVGFEHMAKQGGADRLIENKASVVEACVPGGLVILPASNDRHVQLRAAVERRWPGKILTFGSHPDADARLLERKFDAERLGWHVRACIGDREVEAFVPRPDEHAPASCLAPLLVIHALGGSVEQAAARIALYKSYKTEGLLTTLHFGERQVLLYDKSERAYLLGQEDFLRTVARLQPSPGGRKIMVLGDVYDEQEYGPAVWDLLPPDKMRTLLADAGLDLLFTRGPPRQFDLIVPDTVTRGAHVDGTPAKLAPALIAALRSGDLLAIKGDIDEAMPGLVAALKTAADQTERFATRPSVLVGDTQMPNPDSALLQTAWNALAEPDADAVVKPLAALPKALAKTPEGLRLAGRAAWRRGLPEAAMTLLAESVTTDATDPAALVDLAILQMEAGQSDLAERLLRAALDLAPTLPEAHAALATLAEDSGDTDGALRHLRAACAGALSASAGLS